MSNGAELLEITRHGDVRAILSGHTHFTSFHSDGSILLATASGSAFGMDISGKESISFTDASTYLTGRVAKDKVFVSQVDMNRSESILFEFDAQVMLKLMTSH